MTASRDDFAAFEPSAQRQRRGGGWVTPAVGAVLLAIFAALPFLDIALPVVLASSLSSPATLALLSVCLVFAVLALSFDLIFGYAGLLSFGHVLYFALGMYCTEFLLRSGLSLIPAIVLAAAISMGVAVILNIPALRVRGIAYGMVTMAFAEAFYVFLLADPLHMTGKEEGLRLTTTQLPDWLRGVANADNRYWLALGLLALSIVVAWRLTRAQSGRSWVAIRENENRVEALGLVTRTPKLQVVGIAAVIASLAGSVYLIVVLGASPELASPNYSLSLMVMVVLGGVGRVWGAALGGFLYGLLTLRIPALGAEGLLGELPEWLGNLLSEPSFILGIIFILFVLFAPGGIAGIAQRIRESSILRRRGQQSETSAALR